MLEYCAARPLSMPRKFFVLVTQLLLGLGFGAVALVMGMPGSMAMLMVSIIMFTAGLILDSVSRARTEQLRLHYIATAARAAPLDSAKGGLGLSQTEDLAIGTQARIVRERHG